MLSDGVMHQEGRRRCGSAQATVANLIAGSFPLWLERLAHGGLLWAPLGVGRTGDRPCLRRLVDDSAARRSQ
jgi:hypothetical protein